tara:strand:+ start:118040 stop:118594 length:555 start_codon:yes stop_codon:yes gene_type:complete
MSFAWMSTFSCFLFLLVVGGVAHAKKSLKTSFSDEGLKCNYQTASGWKPSRPLFGFSAFTYKVSGNSRSTLGVVVTPVDEKQLSIKNPEQEAKRFAREKRKYIQSKGGKFLGASGPQGKMRDGSYSFSVKYSLNGRSFIDSTHLLRKEGKLFHGKSLFPLDAFSPVKTRNEIQKILRSIKCKTS